MAMSGRWTAALLGASFASLLAGVAIARSIDGHVDLAVASGGFSAVCVWSVLAPLVIAQRSGLKAWGLALGSTALAASWAWSS